MIKKLLFLFSPLFLCTPLFSQTPTLVDEDLSIRSVVESPHESARLAFNAQDSTLYFITLDGQIFSVDIAGGNSSELQTTSDHGLENVQGFDISGDGKFYLVGNRNIDDSTNTGIIKKSQVTGGEWEWVTVAETEPYPLSNTYFDHIMNGIVVSPDNKFLYINSGSRTDHGEEHLDFREVPLTAKILRVPADSTNLLLENDIIFLRENDYLFAEGTRNSFSLTFDAEGNLFATENAGDRDDPEELNWLREGHHYGFPWNIGGNETPMQFEGYDPDEDLLVQKETGAYQFGYFYDDPDYPEPPEGVTFTKPILNSGPDGVNYRSEINGEILNAVEQDTAIGSFTSHRSPLGLVFDTTNALAGDYTGDAFVLSFPGANDNAFLKNMEDSGEDLMHLKLSKTGDTYEMTSTIIVSGFISPVDAEIINNKIYVIEHKNPVWLNTNATTHIWEISFPGMDTSIEEPESDLVKSYRLHQNYPNPFNPSTRISYTLSQPGEVILDIFDALGRKVQTLVEKHQHSGQHTVVFDAEHMPSGVYFYRLTMAGDNQSSQIKKMILLR